MRIFYRALVVTLLVCSAAPQQRSYVDWYQDMAAAYRAGDHAAMARAAEGALAVRPRFPAMMLNLAVARTRLGEHEAALDLLDEVAGMGLSYPIEDIEQLAPLSGSGRFDDIAARMRENREPMGQASVAFTLPRRDFFPEGIAAEASGDFFVGSVRTGEILRIDASGEPAPFSQVPWSALGMRVDRQRALLWVAISGLEQRTDLVEARRGRAGIAAVDLESGAHLGEYLLPAGVERVVGDVVVGADGSVYATDSIAGGLWVLRPGTSEPVAVLPDGALASPQGLDFTADGRLYVAAYNGGIFRVDERRASARRLAVPDEISVYGVDGLYTDGADLIVVQNGITPHRVMRLQLDDDGTAVAGASALLRADPRFGEPTLGAVLDGSLHLVANSPWAHFADAEQAPEVESLPLPTVLRLSLTSR